MAKDVVIIGGGLGGLVAACLLCKEGYTVTVLERHSRIGGGLHCFDRHGISFETGIHYVSGFQPGGVLQKIFSYLGLYNDLIIKELNNDGFDKLHIASDNKTYSFGVGKDNFIKILSEQFPDEAAGIQRYIDVIYEISSKFFLYNLEETDLKLMSYEDEYLISVGNFIDSFITNKKLANILAWNNSLYAGDKDSTPIYIHALVTKFYIEGASRFVGGSQQLANAMTNFLQLNGSSVYCSCGVTKIEVNNKKVTEVHTTDGQVFKADYYISDIHPSSLLDLIDPVQIQRSYRERLQSLENTYSMFIVYIVLKEESFPFLNYNYYYHTDYEFVWKSSEYKNNAFPEGFMLTTPPEANQTQYANKLIINCVMNYQDVKQWENTKRGNRGKEYEAFKKSCEEKIINQVETVFPSIRTSIDKIFSATPLTIRDYTGSKEGSLYGYKKDCRNMIKSQVLARTKVENLLLTGQNINLHGIIGVPLNALVTVGELVGINSILSKINQY